MIFGRTAMNLPSRFTDEIPAGDMERSGHSAEAPQEQPRPRQRYSPPPRAHSVRPEASAKPAVNFAAGDRVRHTAFGEGEILKLTPMGGDALVEIGFSGGVTKRLMLRAAAQHMEKVD